MIKKLTAVFLISSLQVFGESCFDEKSASGGVPQGQLNFKLTSMLAGGISDTGEEVELFFSFDSFTQKRQTNQHGVCNQDPDYSHIQKSPTIKFAEYTDSNLVGSVSAIEFKITIEEFSKQVQGVGWEATYYPNANTKTASGISIAYHHYNFSKSFWNYEGAGAMRFYATDVKKLISQTKSDPNHFVVETLDQSDAEETIEFTVSYTCPSS